MPSKIEFYAKLAEQTAMMAASSYQGWTSLLRSCGRVYKYPFHEQLMIHAQRPDATACAEYSLWNQRMHRFVRKGSVGIALLDSSGDKPVLRYVFDVADTSPRQNGRSPYLFSYSEEHNDVVSTALEQQFAVSPSVGISNQIENAVIGLTQQYWNEHRQDILDIVDGSFLQEYDEYNVGVSFRNAAEVSATYAVLSRCGLDPEDFFEYEDFLTVFDFNTPQSIIALGSAVSQSSETVLRTIETAIKRYEREKITERSQNHEPDLHDERRLQNPEPESVPNPAAPSGEIREDAESLPEGASPSFVEQPHPVREAVSPPAGDRRDSEPETGTDDAGADEVGGGDGGTESQRPDEVDRTDEQPESTGGGSDPLGADLQISQHGEQLALFPSEQDQIALIDEAERVRPTPSAFSFAQNDIDDVLRLASNSDDSRMVVVSAFQKQKPMAEITALLKKEYHGGAGLKSSGGEFAVWYASDGIHLARGRSARYSPNAQVISWEAAAERIGQLLEEGKFAANVELAEAENHERMTLAQNLLYLRGDMSSEAIEQHFLGSLEEYHSVGFPDAAARLSDALKDPAFRQNLSVELETFMDAYAEDDDMMRFHFHEPQEAWTALRELNLPRREFAADMTEVPKVDMFITEDEIDQTLGRGGNTEDGKERIYAYLTGSHTAKEKADFLKNEYGIGGCSHAVSGQGWIESSGKGICMKKPDCANVELNWNKVLSHFEALIRNDRYFTPEEKARHDEKRNPGKQESKRYNTYNDIKHDHPDDIVLFQVGDFFEMYGEDAKAAARLLDLNLTTRAIAGAGRVEMCGIPARNLEQYVEKLRNSTGVTIAVFNDIGGEYNCYSMQAFAAPTEVIEAEIVVQSTAEPLLQHREITQAEIDEALQRWNGSIESKRAVVRYMADHARERSTAAWLSMQYGGDGAAPLHITVAGTDIDHEMSWTKVQRRLAQLIKEERFFTQEEYDRFEDIDPVAVREELAARGIVDGELVVPEALERDPFIQRVEADVERIAALDAPDRYAIRLHPNEGGITGIWDAALGRFYEEENQVLRFAEQSNAIAYLANIQRTRGMEPSEPIFSTPTGVIYKIGDGVSSSEVNHEEIIITIEKVDEDDVWYTMSSEPQQDLESIDRNTFERYLDTGYFSVMEKEVQPLAQEAKAWEAEQETKRNEAIAKLTDEQRTVVKAFEAAGFLYNPNHREIRFDSDTDGYPLIFQSWQEAAEKIDGAELKLEVGLRDKVQRVLHPEQKDIPYAVGDTVYLDNTAFVIRNIDRFDVQLQTPTQIYPIFRAESKERFMNLLRQDERNRHIYTHDEAQTPTSVDIDTVLDEYPVSIPINGEWQTFPNAAAAEQAAYAEYKENIRRNAQNFRITDDHLGEGGAKAKFRSNMDAINLLKELERTDAQATPEQQTVLSKYVGWGGLADAFDETKKDWENEYQQLRSALTPEEYKAAKASTLNAHYTSPVVIKAIYEAVHNMGFETGNILEPSMGVGNFFGCLPETMQNSRLYGVELDSITGRIARQLYPKADITISGFEKTDRKDFFDLAIGNVPFGQYQVNDPAFNKLHFNIHNYFFAKALDQLRPGGVLAFVTSRYTMDSKDSTVRRYLAERADLLGAIRLPNNAFKANADTEVVSDIIFLQKRETPMEELPDWVSVMENQDGYPVNSYFLDNPHMVLGEQTSESTRYGMDYTVMPSFGKELSDQLTEAIRHIHGTYQEAELPDLGDGEEIRETIPADPNVKNYSYTLVAGEVYYRENSRMVRPKLNSTAMERVKGMIALRQCVGELIAIQMDSYTTDGEIQQKQTELNGLYDAFTQKYGLINDRGNRLAFSDDPSYYLLCSLEVLDEDGKLERKADMFTKRTIRRAKSVTSVDTASEALAISIAEHAKVDMPFMAHLTGKTRETLAADLRGVIFPLPESVDEDGQLQYVTADEYLSGNVRQKLRQAQRAAENADLFQDNVTALLEAQPTDLEASEIDVRLGATWIDKSYIQQFMEELLDPPYFLRRSIKVLYSPYTAEWNITGKSNVSYRDVNANTTYGTSRVNAYHILEDSLNLRDVQVYDTVTDPDGKERRVLNQKETTLAQQKQTAIREEFRSWIWADPERRQTLVKLYNEKFNAVRPREYDGSHISFVGMSPEINLREHQRNAIAHVLYGGNTLLAHEVGSGKTFEMVAAAMESKRLGLCSKSLIVVPNHLTEQWASEFLRLYPSANILVARKKDFEPARRKTFCAKIATGDYDAVIMGHSQFEKIPVSLERQERTIQSQIDEIEDGILELQRSGAERFTVKSLERTKRSLEARLEKLLKTDRKDNVVTFEQLGVDRLFVDEAHAYKNLFLYTKMRNVAGISTSDAQKSSDMYMKCQYMDELTGGRGVIFATGTPVSNSMTELYTMMRYLQSDTLKQNGWSHFDCWAAHFGETKTVVELAPEGYAYLG